jgi:hypothetical protein
MNASGIEEERRDLPKKEKPGWKCLCGGGGGGGDGLKDQQTLWRN